MSSKSDAAFYRYVYDASGYVLVLWIKHGERINDTGTINYSYCFVSPEDFENSHREEISEILNNIQVKYFSPKTEKFFNKWFGRYRLYALEGKFTRLTKDGAKKEIKDHMEERTYSIEVKLINGRLNGPISDYIVKDMKERNIQFPNRWRD